MEDGTIVRKDHPTYTSPTKLPYNEVKELRLEATDAPGHVVVSVEPRGEERAFYVRRKLQKMVMSGDGSDMSYGFKPGLNTIHVIGIESPDGSKMSLLVRPDGSVKMTSATRGE